MKGLAADSDASGRVRDVRGTLVAVREWFIVAPAYVVPGLASFLLVPVLFAALGASEYGRWVLMYAVAVGVPQLTSTWLEAATLRFGHRETIDVRLTVFALATTTAVAAVATLLFIPGADELGVVATAVYTATIASYVLAIARLQASQRFGSLVSTAVLRSLFGALFAAVCGLAWHTASAVAAGSAAGYLFGVVVASARDLLSGVGPADSAAKALDPASTLASAASAGSAKPERMVEGVLIAEAPSQTDRPALSARFAGASVVIAVAVFILSVGDRFILSMFRPLSEVGVYAATYNLADLAGRLIPSVVLVTLRPRLFRAWDAGEQAWVRSQALLAGVVLGWVGIVVGLVLLVLAAARIHLPIEATLVGPISVGLAALFAANAVGLVYTAAGRQGKLAAVVASSAALVIVADLALVPIAGAQAAAAVTLVAYAVQLGLAIRWVPRPSPQSRMATRWLPWAVVATGGVLAATSAAHLGAAGAIVVAVGLLAAGRPVFRAVIQLASRRGSEPDRRRVSP